MRNRRAAYRGVVLAGAAVALVGLPAVGSSAAPALATAADGRIAYTHGTSFTSQLSDVLSISPKGGTSHTVAAGESASPEVAAGFPVYSPNGAKIAFSRGPVDGRRPVYLAAADGSRMVQVTHPSGPDATQDTPQGFAPDGTKLAFERQVDAGSSTLWQTWVVDLGTGVETRMGTSDVFSYGVQNIPAGGGQVFSADGTHVVLSTTSFTSGIHEVYRAKVSDGTVEQVTDVNAAHGWAQFAAYSPTGTTIAFGASAPGVCGIYAVADGATNAKLADSAQLSTTPCSDVDQMPAPVWSPDGTKLALFYFQSVFSPSFAGPVTVIPANGTGSTPTPVTTVPAGSTALLPLWSADGSRIAYTAVVLGSGTPVSAAVEVVSLADATHTPHAITTGPVDIATSWQRVQPPNDVCKPGAPAPPGYHLIEGTAGPDHLVGTDGPDLIRGLGGDDKILGRGGRDILCGGDGNDVIQGNCSADRIYGGAGDDRISGGDGDDRIDGGAGHHDVATGGPGNDHFIGVEDQTP